jgi:hypothetical protein
LNRGSVVQATEGYLNAEFRKGASRLNDIYNTLVEIAKFFMRSYETGRHQWYYEFPGQSPREYSSCSTQAMCAFALMRLTTAAFWHERDDDEQDICGTVKAYKRDCVDNLCAQLNQKAQQGEKVWTSSTYGEEDPLTAAWIVELFCGECCSPAYTVRDKLQDTIYTALRGGFDQIIRDGNRAGAHAFPVYRLVSAVKKMRQDASKWKMAEKEWQRLLSRAGYWFEQELHKQLSHHHFNDFRFDAPELIYSLAGALQTSRLRGEDPLIHEVLEVIRVTQQQRSVYWRPYRPFVVKPQGLALMPLSVEVADALLDVWELTDHFDQLKESLVNYYEWLMAQRIEKQIRRSGNVVTAIGWRSENAFGPPEVEKIHTWTTSRVALFLLNYSKLLDHSLQKNLLQNSGLSFKKASALIPWKDIQPMDLGRKRQTLQVIEEQFITPHASTLDSEERLNPEGSFSMFLHGPPGTSKTSVAEGLAQRLGLKLVTITVSDFIMLGVEAVEQRAKIIFDVLGELKNIVVLFDEIDRLITDRDSDRYFEQRDILQLMTPSMLTKLNDLRRKRKLLFVVSTNYFERIDRAIRRPGRIDQHFLISPFDQKSRAVLLRNFICKFKGLGQKGKDWEFPSNAETRLNNIAKLAPLLVFEELKGVFDRSTSRLGKGDIKGLLRNLEREIRRVNPSITLESYKRKFGENKLDPEPPFMEFFFLCFLLAEVDQTDSETRRFFQERWKEWKERNAPDVSGLTSDGWVKEQLRRLAKS